MRKYRAPENLCYFCTLTVVDWIPIFIDKRYVEPILSSLTFCREKKGLTLYGFVIMPNHLHLLAEAGEQLEIVMRDFKRFTSRSVQDILRAENRTTILRWLSNATEPTRRNKGSSSLWKSGFHPKAIMNHKMFEQKLNYIHHNPVRKGLVQRPEDWWYSSAGFFEGHKDMSLQIDVVEI